MYEIKITDTRNNRVRGRIAAQDAGTVAAHVKDRLEKIGIKAGTPSVRDFEQLSLCARKGDTFHTGGLKLSFEDVPAVRFLVVTIMSRVYPRKGSAPEYNARSIELLTPSSVWPLVEDDVRETVTGFNWNSLSSQEKLAIMYGTESVAGCPVVITDEQSGNEVSITSQWIEKN